MTEDYSAINIKIVDNSGYRPTIDPTYVVLGMFNEYFGRLTGWSTPDLVERFYPKEEDTARKFVTYLHEMAAQHHIETKIDVSREPRGHWIISSPELAKFLRDMYGEHGGICESMFPSIPKRRRFQYEKEPVDCRFSYLLGAHLRYGKDNAFQFANASHKVDLIIAFLELLGADWISKAWTIDGAPTCVVIRFGPDEILARLFGTKPAGFKTFEYIRSS